jgi:osmotically-inducible protein OsmY
MKLINRNFFAAAALGTALAVGRCRLRGPRRQEHQATIDDAQIVSKAKAAFALDHTVKAMDIKVQSYNGKCSSPASRRSRTKRAAPRKSCAA